MGAARSGATPRITVALCTYDRHPHLERALGALAVQSLPAAEFHILVIDNSPNRAAAEAFAARCTQFPNLEYRFETKPGLSNARNVAVAFCESPLIAFIDDDALAQPRWLERLVAAFDEIGPGADVVGGPVRPLWTQPRPVWLPDDLLSLLSVLDWGPSRREIELPHEWLVGTNIAFRRDALVAVGGFSTLLGRIGHGAALLSNEEIEVMARIRAAGGGIHYEPGAAVDHVVHADRLTPEWFRRRVVWQRISEALAEALGPAKNSGPKPTSPNANVAAILQTLCPVTRDPDEFRRQVYDCAALVEHLIAGRPKV